MTMANYKVLCAAVVLLATMSVGSSTVTKLNEVSLPEYVADHDNLLVLFYEEQCNTCKTFEPKFLKADALLGKDMVNVKSVKIDCSEETLPKKTYYVEKFPTVKLLRKGTPVDYKGDKPIHELEASDLVDWVKENVSGQAIDTLHKENDTPAQ